MGDGFAADGDELREALVFVFGHAREEEEACGNLRRRMGRARADSSASVDGVVADGGSLLSAVTRWRTAEEQHRALQVRHSCSSCQREPIWSVFQLEILVRNHTSVWHRPLWLKP